MTSSDSGWGGGEMQPEPESTEAPSLEELIIQLGRVNREANVHLARIRGYLGFIVLVIVLNSIALTLWLAGVIEVTTSTSRSPF